MSCFKVDPVEQRYVKVRYELEVNLIAIYRVKKLHTLKTRG